jgi:hypothetical protein
VWVRPNPKDEEINAVVNLMSQQAHPRLEKRSDNLVRASLNAIFITEITETEVGESSILCVVQEGIKVKILQYIRSINSKVEAAKASLWFHVLAYIFFTTSRVE